MNHLHKALLKVEHTGPGICEQVSQALDHIGYEDRKRAWVKLTDLFTEWPEGTGSPTYPVPSPDPGLDPGLDRVDAFTEHVGEGTLWVGPYGESRKRLLAFLLEQTK